MTPEIAAPVAVVPYWSYWVVPLATVFFGTLQVIVLAYINRKTNSISAVVEETKTTTAQVATATAQVAVATAETAVSVEKAHVAINSERTAMQEELKKMHEIILELSKEKAAHDQSVMDNTTKGGRTK